MAGGSFLPRSRARGGDTLSLGGSPLRPSRRGGADVPVVGPPPSARARPNGHNAGAGAHDRRHHGGRRRHRARGRASGERGTMGVAGRRRKGGRLDADAPTLAPSFPAPRRLPRHGPLPARDAHRPGRHHPGPRPGPSARVARRGAARRRVRPDARRGGGVRALGGVHGAHGDRDDGARRRGRGGGQRGRPRARDSVRASGRRGRLPRRVPRAGVWRNGHGSRNGRDGSRTLGDTGCGRVCRRRRGLARRVSRRRCRERGRRRRLPRAGRGSQDRGCRAGAGG